MSGGAPIPAVGPQPTSERIWLVYLACVLAIAVGAAGGGHEGHAPWLCVAFHVGVLAGVLLYLRTRDRPSPALPG